MTTNDSVYKTPQVHLIGRIFGGYEFDQSDSMYVKYTFQTGSNWDLLSGIDKGETFQSKQNDEYELFFPLEQPFDLNYATKAIRGWPKLQIEAWQVDSSGRHSIAGYGQITIPSQPGEYSLDVFCWRPYNNFFSRLVKAHSELVHKDVVLCSENRLNFDTESSGRIKIEVSVICKDFQFHGVELFPDLNELIYKSQKDKVKIVD